VENDIVLTQIWDCAATAGKPTVILIPSIARHDFVEITKLLSMDAT